MAHARPDRARECAGLVKPSLLQIQRGRQCFRLTSIPRHLALSFRSMWSVASNAYAVRAAPQLTLQLTRTFRHVAS
jgi:hypothetical protein